MRIIGGNFKGKKLVAPSTLPVRPTTDFAKTGLFNIINNRYRFSAISVLDLFTGTGSITFELFSRGCVNVIAVDKDAGCIKFIDEILEILNAPATVQTIQAYALPWLQKANESFDIIFADPPFEMEIAEALIKIVFESDKLLPGGTLILEHSSARRYSHLPQFIETRKYGNVSFSFFGRHPVSSTH